MNAKHTPSEENILGAVSIRAIIGTVGEESAAIAKARIRALAGIADPEAAIKAATKEMRFLLDALNEMDKVAALDDARFGQLANAARRALALLSPK